jgi:predicted benzoate:H+ symporter BenE
LFASKQNRIWGGGRCSDFDVELRALFPYMTMRTMSLDSQKQMQGSSLREDWSLSAITAGLLAVLISYAGPLAILFEAGRSAHASNAMVASWVWGISIGSAICGIALSWLLKQPIITAWSAPGTALLVTLFPALPLNEAIGAYITAGLIILSLGHRATSTSSSKRFRRASHQG